MPLFFTRTGKTKRGDRAHGAWWPTRTGRWLLSRSNWYSFVKRPGMILGIPWLSPRRGGRDEAIVDDRLPSERVPWHSIPEAELSDAQEHEAQSRVAGEWHRDDD